VNPEKFTRPGGLTEEERLECADCGMPYHDFPDMRLPDAIWRLISPKGNQGGILCPTCICKRLRELGATVIYARPDKPEATQAEKLTEEERGELRELEAEESLLAASNAADSALIRKTALRCGAIKKSLSLSDAYDALEQENERLRGQIHEADALLESTRSMTAGASTYQAVDLVVALDKVIQQAREALPRQVNLAGKGGGDEH